MKKILFCLSLISACGLLAAGCGSRDAGVQTAEFPPTDKVETVFQAERIPDSCRVFAQLFATMPASYTGARFAEAVRGEAMAKGADMVLIGHSRQSTGEDDLQFTYYGPGREYRIREWPPWRYGFEKWQEQGAWANIGYMEWGNSDIYYDYPILMQVAFVRCQ
jgi:hypothetical protein